MIERKSRITRNNLSIIMTEYVLKISLKFWSADFVVSEQYILQLRIKIWSRWLYLNDAAYFLLVHETQQFFISVLYHLVARIICVRALTSVCSNTKPIWVIQIPRSFKSLKDPCNFSSLTGRVLSQRIFVFPYCLSSNLIKIVNVRKQNLFVYKWLASITW